MKPEITVVANGSTQQIQAGLSVADFIQLSGWKPTQVVVEYNGNVLERNALSNQIVADGDRLEVIVPVAGG